MNYIERLKYNREWRKETSRKRRDYLHDVLGRKCAKCGFDDDRILQIDHVMGDGRRERKAAKDYNWMVRNICEMSKVDGNMFKARYQLLCPNCNWIKRIENNEV